MLAVLALALGCAACTDRSPVLTEPKPEAELLGVLQCTADVRTLQMTCTEATPETGGVSPALFGTSQVKLTSSNVAHDAGTGIFGMDVTAQNLLSYAIGTPDGTTRAGFKVFFEVGPNATYYTPGDTGTVRVRNPDGLQNFTAAQQPYHFYDTILQPQEVSAAKRWEFTVPATVKSFSFSVRVFTATQKENRVPMAAPQVRPAWFGDPSRSVNCMPYLPGTCLKDVVVVRFAEGAPQEERQSAVDLVRGRVIGGSRGAYYVSLPATTDSQFVVRLSAAIQQLENLPQIASAVGYSTIRPTPDYLTPHDSVGWREWKLNPDSADGQNWGFERVAAPYAWGCSVGDSVRIGVVDQGFHPIKDLVRNAELMPTTSFPTESHGTRVASIAAAFGNDTSGMTGMMWRARLRMYEATSAGSDFQGVWDHVARARLDGARVINVSLGVDWATLGVSNPKSPNPTEQKAMEALARTFYLGFKDAMEDTTGVTPATARPLVVFSAGNADMDAKWAPGRVAADSTPADASWAVLVVGASTLANQKASFSNHGSVVRIAAPGENVYSLDREGGITAASGTSFAAPFVTGVAGMLFSFDPRLTAVDVREFILQGAIRGDRTAAGLAPILNARESLILAGRRLGAPLCGNRLWIHGGTAYAQRDTSPGATAEALFALPSSAGYYLDPLHGGKAVEVAGGTNRMMRWRLTAGVPEWTAGPVPPVGYPYFQPGANGTTLSGEGRSHSRDTLFRVIQQPHRDGDAITRYRFRLETSAGTVTLPDSITRPYRYAPMCIQVFDSTDGGFLKHLEDNHHLIEPYEAWRQNVRQNGECVTHSDGEIRRTSARAAYAPEGRHAYVFVSEQVSEVGAGAYERCRTLQNFGYIHEGEFKAQYFYVHGKCRPATIILRSGRPVIYRVDVKTGAAVLLSDWTDDPLTRGEFGYPALREDANEVALQLIQRESTGEYTWRSVSANDQVMQYRFTDTRTCVQQFRDLRTGKVLFTPPSTCNSEAIGISATRESR